MKRNDHLFRVIAAFTFLIATHGLLAKGNPSTSNKVSRAVVKALKKVNPHLSVFSVEDSKVIDSGEAVVIVRGNSDDDRIRQMQKSPTDVSQLLREELFGVFILNQSGKIEMVLDIFPTKRFLDYGLRIAFASDELVKIRGSGNTYGDQSMKRVYQIDPKRKAVR